MKFRLHQIIFFGLAAGFFILSGCSSQRVTPTVQRPAPVKNPRVETKTPPKNSVVTTPPKMSPPLAAQPIKELKIVPKVQTPEALLNSLNNLSQANDLIENKLNLNELEAAAADPALIQFKPQILLKVGKLYQKNKEPDRAAEYYRALTTLYPQNVSSTQAAVLLSSLQNPVTTAGADSNVIGAILPLTGRNASIGQHALNAIRLGLGLNKPDSNFRIALFDSQSDPELAAQGVDKLVNEDKAIAILGGFSSKEASSIASRAELLSVPFVGFSQKPGLTNVGEYVFRNALTPEMQVDRIVQFAFDKLAAKKFAIIYPNDSYGVELSNAFWDHVLARGGQVTAAQTYDPKTTDFSDVVQKMVGTYYTEAREDEMKKRVKEIRTARKAKNPNPKTGSKGSQRDGVSDANILPPVIDFDVVFVPDSSRALGQILAFMKFNDVIDMNYLGTNLWNSSDLPKRAANEDAAIYFVDAVDVTTSQVQDSGFYKDYLAAYNEEPTLVEIQTFEVAQILKQLISAGATGRESLAAGLRALGTSTLGVTGELEMSPSRELIRPVHVMMLDSGVVKKVE